MIGKIVAIGLLAITAVASTYKAGKYANGGKDVSEGPVAAVASGINAIITAGIAVLLYLNI